MLSNIIIFSIIGIVIVIMVVVVILYRKRTNRMNKKEKSVNDGKNVTSDYADNEEVLEKIVHETIPALRNDYIEQIKALNDKISKIETSVLQLKNTTTIEEKPKEEEISANIIGIKTEKGIKLIFLTEDIKVPKRLVPNEENVEEGKKQLSNDELEEIIFDAIKNGNTTFTSIIHAIEGAGEEMGNIKVGNILKRMIDSGKLVKNEDKTYSIPQK